MRLLICFVMALPALVGVAHAQDKSTLLDEIADLKVEAKRANTSMSKVIMEIAASKAAGSTKGTNAPRSATAVKVKKNPKDGADMILIPAGEFVMGGDEFTGSQPAHKVTLDEYYIYRTPVTVAQYLKFCDETGYKKRTAPSFNPDWSKRDHPMVNVSYNDALAYCKWAGVRLPTEAEWEKAASWDDAKKEKRRFPWGDEFDTSKLWCSIAVEQDAGGTKAVGSYPSGASAYGVLDMAGNVWQWCSDWYDEKFYGNRLATERNAENQSIGEKKERVMRGGSYRYTSSWYFQTFSRLQILPSYWSGSNGFRCVSGQ